MSRKNVLYRVYDTDGNLLYVGATTNFAQRLTTHSTYQPWWDDASRVELEHFDSFEDMAEAEVQAIRSEQPRYNVVFAHPTPGPRRPRRQRGDGTIYRRADGVWIGRVELEPHADGRRRQKTVSSKNRETVVQKLEAVKAAVDHG